MVALMHELGHDRFSVIGHDRGALVAFRAALDYPDVITHLGLSRSTLYRQLRPTPPPGS